MIFFANWIHDKIGIPQSVTYITFSLVVVTALYRYFAKQRRKFRAIKLANVDSMTGIEFERYLRQLLTSRG